MQKLLCEEPPGRHEDVHYHQMLGAAIVHPDLKEVLPPGAGADPER